MASSLTKKVRAEDLQSRDVIILPNGDEEVVYRFRLMSHLHGILETNQGSVPVPRDKLFTVLL